MEKSKASTLLQLVDNPVMDTLHHVFSKRHDAYAPILMGMVSLLYFTQFPSHDALVFSALGFTGLALISQFSRIGFWIALALQSVFFGYIVSTDGILSTEQTLFSIGMVLASAVALLNHEADLIIQEESLTASFVKRLNEQEHRAEKFHRELQSVIERAQSLAHEREALLLENAHCQSAIATLTAQKDAHAFHVEKVAVEIEECRKESQKRLEAQHKKHEEQMLQAQQQLEQQLQQQAHQQSQQSEQQLQQQLQQQAHQHEQQMLQKIAEYASSEKQHASEVKEEANCDTDAEPRYKQLREQFQEKSRVLDETRKQLFHTEEQVLALQIKLEEPSEDVLRLTKEMALLEDVSRAQEILFKKEIEAYEELVETLFQQIALSESNIS